MAWLPKEMNGNGLPVVPAAGGSYLDTIACWSAVSVSSGTPWSACTSLGWKSRYWLVYEAPWKEKVGVFGSVSVDEDLISDRLPKVPNRDSATIMGQRSAAQYGQNSAPM